MNVTERQSKSYFRSQKNHQIFQDVLDVGGGENHETEIDDTRESEGSVTGDDKKLCCSQRPESKRKRSYERGIPVVTPNEKVET